MRTCGERILFGGGYGMTEACGLLTLVYWQTERTDLLGLPTPGVEMKLVRIEGGRWDCRVRGPNVFAGYGDAFDAESFDDEGHFITGDAVEFASDDDPAQGLVFAGRIKEDFKLANGTWVRAGRLREALLDRLRPHAADLIIVGENRHEVAALVWPSNKEGPQLSALTAGMTPEEQEASPEVAALQAQITEQEGVVADAEQAVTDAQAAADAAAVGTDDASLQAAIEAMANKPVDDEVMGWAKDVLDVKIDEMRVVLETPETPEPESSETLESTP